MKVRNMTARHDNREMNASEAYVGAKEVMRLEKETL